MTKPSLFDLFRRLHAIEIELWDHHKIRFNGPYAERLVAAALGAELHSSGVHHGSDLLHPELKRIEVRSRRRPLENRDETRITIPEGKRNRFDHCVHVVFDCDYTVWGAYIVPHDAIFQFIDHGHDKVPYSEGLKLPGARDITLQLVETQRLL